MHLNINIDFIHFLVVGVFGFLIGLEVKSYRKEQELEKRMNYFFGEVRTFSFVAILGFILFKIDSHSLLAYLAGFLALTALYGILYHQNLKEEKRSILLFVVMLLVYTFGPLISTQPLWMTALLYVSIVFILNSNRGINNYLSNINVTEFETFGKMVLLSIVILPLLPDTKILPYIPLSPFKIWFAVVVISGISYGGYIVQKYLFPSKGYYLTGIFGGSYSSTATTVVLAKKAKNLGGLNVIDAAIISATSVMYLRLVAIAFIFNMEVGKELLVPFILLSITGFVVSFFYLKNNNNTEENTEIADQNPLELKTAFIFASLFVIMMIITNFVTKNYGNSGLEILSFIVGLTDIDPFILSIVTGKFDISTTQIVTAIMIASGSNNLLKASYALWFGGVKNSYKSAMWIFILGVVTIALGFGVKYF